MIGKLNIVTLSNKVHPATEAMLMRYPATDLRYYAGSLGIKPIPKTKVELVAKLMERGATICGSIGT